MATTTDLPTPNMQLLRKVWEWVVFEAGKAPSSRQWDQGNFRGVDDCGTTYCVAGYVCLVQGHEWFSPTADARLSDGRMVYDVAKAELGLTNPEAHELFLEAQDLVAVRDAMRDVAARAGETL